MNKELQEKLDEFLDTLQTSNRSFLIGAGCSKCAKLPLTEQLADMVNTKLPVGKTKTILEYVITNFTSSSNTTIEEFISEIVDYAAILERRVEKGSTSPTIKLSSVDYTEQELKRAVTEIQMTIVDAIEENDFELKHHNSFINAIHNRLDNGKNMYITPTNYFVLNYDTLIEDALSMNKISYADGFRGGAIGWWDVSVFNDNNIKARLFKLHGSLDWCISKDDTMPRRLKRKSKHPNYNFEDNVLIYPCATKYKETQNDPFAQLLQHYRDKLRNSDKAVLTICGYRFADTHINVEIEKALSEGRNLTLVIFTEADTPNDNEVLKKWFENKNFKPNILFFTKKGYYHDNLIIEASAGSDLDWWKFEKLTELLNN
jgi:hypothetical protein